MNDQPHFSSTFSHQSTSPGTPQYPGAFFPGAVQTTIHGGIFTSNVRIEQVAEEDYRRIPRGDIRLLREIRLEEPGVAWRNTPRNIARRILTAKVHPTETERAVVLYEGINAEEERQKYVERHSKFWHPNILQIFGLTNYSGAYAVITHEDLMPYREFLALQRPSPVMTVYIYACWRCDFESVRKFGRSQMRQVVSFDDHTNTSWIRRSTGRLCIEFEHSSIDQPPDYLPHYDFPVDAPLALDDPAFETRMVQILPEDTYSSICTHELGKMHDWGPFVRAEVRMGTLVLLPPGTSDNLSAGTVVAHLPSVDMFADILDDSGWRWLGGKELIERVDVAGWTRFNWGQRAHRALISLDLQLTDFYWLAQANHIFRLLQVTTDHKQYISVDSVSFDLNILSSTGSDRLGAYLFVCPPDQLRTGSDSFAWPPCPWFWSLDPNGDHPLTEDDASHLGLPMIKMEIEIDGHSWHSSVYQGLRTFHAAKGFDPDSQELAQHLGFPMYEVSEPGLGPALSNVSDEANIPDEFFPECLDPLGKRARQIARSARATDLAEWKTANHQIAERNAEKTRRFKADKATWARRERGQVERPREELARLKWTDYHPETRSRRPIKMLDGAGSYKHDGDNEETDEGGVVGRRNRRRTRQRAYSPY